MLKSAACRLLNSDNFQRLVTKFQLHFANSKSVDALKATDCIPSHVAGVYKTNQIMCQLQLNLV